MTCAVSLLPILHAGPYALLAGRGHALHGQLAEAASHHGHGAELAARAAAAGAAGVLLAVEAVVGAPAHGPVVRAHERHLHT